MKKAIRIFLFVVVILSLSGCYQINLSTPSSTDGISADTDLTPENVFAGSDNHTEEAVIEGTFSVEAAGLTLQYPEKWHSEVSVDISENKAAFSCDKTPLFDITFNSDEGILLGTIIGISENTVLRLVEYGTDGDPEKIQLMREDVSVILNHLRTDYIFISGEEVTAEAVDTFDIVTPVVTLKYPVKWKEKTDIEITDTKAAFSCDGVPLFDLVFEVCDGYFFGTYKNTPIYIVAYDTETDEQALMQEDSNVILDALKNNADFKPAN